jgi:hypothetical protein
LIFILKVNIFATIKVAIRFRKVTYYSVQFEEDDESLFLQFVNKHAGIEYNEQMALIRSWLRKIGEEIGAKEQYFRFEGFRSGDARALPPPARYLDIECNLRLYCMRVSSGAVILFNGAEKTAERAQDCRQVRPHFLLANQLTKAIDLAIKDGDIQINTENDDLILNDEPIIEL